MSKNNLKVAVLLGGPSLEREVSLVSGAAVGKALRGCGFDVTEIDVGRDVGKLVSDLSYGPDVVFNALHGRFGEDGSVQGVLNILGIPYTHSGLMASSIAMDKPMAKKLFINAGIKVAPHIIANRDEVLGGNLMEPPYVVKPINEGSSVDVHIIHGDVSEPLTENNWPYGDSVMVEKFIPGRELTVAVMGAKALAVTEITTGRDFYDYDAKYSDGGSAHVLPADVPSNIYDEAMRLAQLAHDTLGCRGVSRADFRFDGEDIYILEVNTQPGMTATSLVPEQAAHVGIDFGQLVTWMIDQAEYDQ